MQIHEVDQGTEDWFRLRAGMPTASEFAAVLSPGKGKAESKTRRTYMLKLAGELITGEPMDHPTTYHMERGKRMEDEARDLYSFINDVTPQRIGFITNRGAGCSPDSLVGDDGMLEIKTKLPHLMLDVLLTNEFPEEHKAQCQGALWVAEREWIDLVVYWPTLPPFIRRAYRDEEYIATLAEAVATFNDDLRKTVETINQMQMQVAA